MYTILDIFDVVCELVSAPIFLCLRQNDEWQQVFAPILVGDDEFKRERTTVLEVAV